MSALARSVRRGLVALARVVSAGMAMAQDALGVIDSFMSAQDIRDSAAIGKTFGFREMSMIRVRDGAFAHQADCYDARGFYKQLGLK